VGKVGAAFVQLLVEARAEVIVADSNERAVRDAAENYGVKGVEVEDIHTVDCDFYSPCALGGGLNESTIPGLNCQAIVGSANNQLATDEDADRIADRGIIYAPDFVVNAGGLINVHDELHGYSKMRAMHRVDSIFDATKAILLASKEQQVSPNQAAMMLAEDRIREIGDLRRFRRSGEDLS
jgi:glutamate dehydrogenase/leucine dehydrogenase